MKLYCEFMDLHRDDKEVRDILYYKVTDPKYRKYYNFYGTLGCGAKKYREKNLEEGMIDISKGDELSRLIYKKFQKGERITMKNLKQSLQEIYRDLGIKSKAKATDLGKYFKLTRICITLPDKKIENGFRLDPLM